MPKIQLKNTQFEAEQVDDLEAEYYENRKKLETELRETRHDLDIAKNIVARAVPRDWRGSESAA